MGADQEPKLCGVISIWSVKPYGHDRADLGGNARCVAGRRVMPLSPMLTVFNAQRFDYLRCLSCGAVFVDPVPDTITFELMYTKDAYHDRHYFGGECEEYAISAQMLRKFLPEGAAVLYYGCGFGAFLKALRSGRSYPDRCRIRRRSCEVCGILFTGKGVFSS